MGTIELKHITKTFGPTVKAVDNLNLTIESGHFICLLGPSGCGKTTTLRMIAGLDMPDSGEIILDGKILFSGDKGNLVPTEKRELGLVFQSYALWPHMTVAQNVSFGLEMRNVEKNKRKKIIGDVLDLLHISPLENRYPSQLSGGQQQRVALARMLAVSPDVLLLDEPLSNLDAKLRLEMRAELKRLHETLGNTIIYVTHDQLEAMTMSTKIAVMHEGLLQQCAPPMEIYRKPGNVTVAEFVGSPPMNLFSHTGGRQDAVVESIKKCYPKQQDAIDIIGVRPEDIKVVPRGTEASNDTWCYPAEVQTLLPTGSEWVISLLVEDVMVFASVADDPEYKPQTPAAIAVKKNTMHLFDTQRQRIEFSGSR